MDAAGVATAGYRRTRGSRPLLFERLIESVHVTATQQRDPSEPGPPRLHNADDLRASIAREITRLLNTRVPVPIEVLERRVRSTIDYGIPDLSAFPPRDQNAMVRLARHVRDAITAYEPRLRNPVVEIKGSSQNAGMMMLTIRGVPEMGTMRGMPMSFEMLLGSSPAGADAV